MKRSELLEVAMSLVEEDAQKRETAVHRLDSLPLGFLEDHPLPKAKIKPILPKLAETLNSTNSERVREWCAQLLGEAHVGSPEYVPALTRALDSKGTRTLISVIWALGDLAEHAAPAVSKLAPLLKHHFPEVRWRVAWAIERIGQSEAPLTLELASLFQDSDPLVRGYAVLAFAKLAPRTEATKSQLMAAAGDLHAFPRMHAEAALRQWTT